MIFKDSRFLTRFVEFYKENLLRRFFMGFLLGISIWILILIFSFVLRPFVGWNDFGLTVLNDIPGIGLIIAFIVTLEIWGLIPQPSGEKLEKKEKKIEENKNLEDSSQIQTNENTI